ncbi:MAG: precorrin-6A/cobalt-precorrin-6A reductase, partial [Rhodospirillales bacterium]|nr:precorrin-6A/cobalt-precorrin-6A reductase [Rhodospirillales bacterium]
ITGRAPFTVHDERLLIAEHRIDVLVTKNSGGVATEAKLSAAREAGIPVVMVKRPAPPPGHLVDNVDAALEWLESRL